jgi:hypothetical protein
MHLLSHMSHMAQSSWLCVCPLHPASPKSRIPCPKACKKFACIVQSQGGKGESAVTEMLIQKHKEEGAHDKLEVRLPSLNMPRSMSISFLFFFSLFQCPTPHTLSHLQMWLSAPITGQLHLRMQEDFSTDPGDQIQDVARLARLRWDLSGDQCGSGEIYDICCFARILTAEYLRMCQVLDMTDWLRKHLGLLQDEGF